MGVILVENLERMDFVAFAQGDTAVVYPALDMCVFVKLFHPWVSGNKMIGFSVSKPGGISSRASRLNAGWDEC